MNLHVHGAGKVGRALARALRASGCSVRMTSHRRSPTPAVHASTVILAVCDGQLAQVAATWADSGCVPKNCVVLHVAGGCTPEVLAPLRSLCAGLGQMHPLLSFAGGRSRPVLRGAHLLIDGDPKALRAAKQIARKLKMTPRSMPELDRRAYHAAAGMLAGGATALAAASVQVLAAAGVEQETALRMLAPLLRSVADNLQAVGLPEALSGVVRRGDVAALDRHLAAIDVYGPSHAGLYAAVSLAQIDLAGELGEAPPEALVQMQARLAGRTGSAWTANSTDVDQGMRKFADRAKVARQRRDR